MQLIFGFILIFLLLWCPGCQGFFLPDWFINWFGYSRPRPISTVVTSSANLPYLQGRNKLKLDENSNNTVDSKGQEPSGVEVYTNAAGIFSRPNDDNAEIDPKKSWRPSRPLNIFDSNFNPFHTQNSYTPVLMPFKHSFFPGLVVQGGYPFGKPKPCYLDNNHQHHGHETQVDFNSNDTNTKESVEMVPAANTPVLETTTIKAVDPVAYSASNYANVELAKEEKDTKEEPITDPIWEAIQEVMHATGAPDSFFAPPVDRDDHRPTKLTDLSAPSSSTIIRVQNGQNQAETMVLSAMLLNGQNNQYSAPDVQSYLQHKIQPSTNRPILTTSRSTTTTENVTQEQPIYSIPLSHNHTILGSSRGFRPVNQYPSFQRVWKAAIHPTSPYPIKLPISPVARQEGSTNNRELVENITVPGIRLEGGFKPMRLMRRKPFNVNTLLTKFKPN